MRALLIRHASSTHQAADAPLSPAGEAQALALVPVLTALRAGPLYASPFRRAQATIAPYAKAIGQVVTLLPELRERKLSDGDLPDWQDHIAKSFDDPAHHADGGESVMDVRHRAARALATIEAWGGGLPTFVTHGGVTSALFSACAPDFDFDAWRALRNPDLFEVHINAGQIVSFDRIDLKETT